MTESWHKRYAQFIHVDDNGVLTFLPPPSVPGALPSLSLERYSNEDDEEDIDAEFSNAENSFSLLNRIIELKMIQELSNQDFFLFYLGQNLEWGLSNMMTMRTRERLFNESLVNTVMWPWSKKDWDRARDRSLKELEKDRENALEQIRRLLPKTYSLDDYEITTRDTLEDRLRSSRKQFSLLHYKTQILERLAEIRKHWTEMQDLENRYVNVENTNEPDAEIIARGQAVCGNDYEPWHDDDPVLISRRIICYFWNRGLNAIHDVEDDIVDRIEMLIRLVYDPQFQAASLGFVRYGETLGEDMPPWREQDLEKMVMRYEDTIRSLEQKLLKVKDELTKRPDIDELRCLYTGKGKMQKNASEKRLREKHKQELELKLQNTQTALDNNRIFLERESKQLDDFLTKKALLAKK